MVAIGDVEVITVDWGYVSHASLISAIITQLHKLRGFEVVLSKGSFSWGMPHPDSVCSAGSISVWDVQAPSTRLCCRFEKVNTEWTGGEEWTHSSELWLIVLLHTSYVVK